MQTKRGGIGKTTTATTLAGILNQKRKNFINDADPQGNSTSTYQAAIEDTATLYDVMVDEDPCRLMRLCNTWRTELLASDPLLGGKTFRWKCGRMYRLQDALETLDGYDYIVIDTAPSLDIVLYNCLIAADEVIIPVTADAFALQGLTKLSDTIHAVQKRQNRNLQIAGFACEVRRPLNLEKKKMCVRKSRKLPHNLALNCFNGNSRVRQNKKKHS